MYFKPLPDIDLLNEVLLYDGKTGGFGVEGEKEHFGEFANFG